MRYAGQADQICVPRQLYNLDKLEICIRSVVCSSVFPDPARRIAPLTVSMTGEILKGLKVKLLL